MSKKMKAKFIASIIIGLELFGYCAFCINEMISVPLEIGIGTIIVMITSIFVDNMKREELKIEIWQAKLMYCGFLLIVITLAVIVGDFMKKNLH